MTVSLQHWKLHSTAGRAHGQAPQIKNLARKTMGIKRSRQTHPNDSPRSGYRWCSQQEQYVPIAVCKKRAEAKARCRRCVKHWQQWCSQLPLPFGKTAQ